MRPVEYTALVLITAVKHFSSTFVFLYACRYRKVRLTGCRVVQQIVSGTEVARTF